MSNWEKDYKWVVSNKGIGSASGADITAANIFKGNAYINATRELLQNIEDAKDTSLPDKIPSRAVFELLYMDEQDIPGSERISDIINRCVEYISEKGDGENPAILRLKNANVRYLSGVNRIPVLKVSDYNTVGLCANNFRGLLREEGIRHKSGDSSGSFGYGKYAPYRLSQLNTILYASLTNEGEYRFEGRAIFSTFRDADKKEKLNLTLFGEESGDGEDCLPIEDMKNVPKAFYRTEPGTDLYIVGFEPVENWHHLIALSALENFFYAIMKDKIEVEILGGEERVLINSSTLSDQMFFYREFYNNNLADNTQEIRFSAPCYWEVLNSPDVIHVPIPDIRHKGSGDFFFRPGPSDMNKTVLEMRRTGMKIREETFKYITDFCGVFIATADGREHEGKDRNISIFLRSLETATHSSWNSNDAAPEDRDEAGKVLKEITKQIRAAVLKRAQQDEGQKFGAYGLGQFLTDDDAGDGNAKKESAYIRFQPVEIPQIDQRKPARTRAIKRAVNGRGHNKRDEEDETNSNNSGGNRNPNNRQRQKNLREISLKKLRAPYDLKNRMYRVSFAFAVSYDRVWLKTDIVDEDNELSTVFPKEAICGGTRLKIDGEFIELKNIRKEERVNISLKLQDMGRFALRVTAYAEHR